MGQLNCGTQVCCPGGGGGGGEGGGAAMQIAMTAGKGEAGDPHLMEVRRIAMTTSDDQQSETLAASLAWWEAQQHGLILKVLLEMQYYWRKVHRFQDWQKLVNMAAPVTWTTGKGRGMGKDKGQRIQLYNMVGMQQQISFVDDDQHGVESDDKQENTPAQEFDEYST